MHHALYVEEILLNIFTFCYVVVHRWPPLPPKQLWYANTDLAALARTCKTFKEPALDMIWTELEDLTPLVRCLPETSWVKSQGVYTLKKPLEQSDWDIVLGYTRRVRALPHLRGSSGLSADCIEELSRCPASIFPNLGAVGLNCPKAAIAPFLPHLSNSRLTKLSLALTESLDTIETFGEQCPTVSEFSASQRVDASAVSGLLNRWQNLTTVICDDVGLDLKDLCHLSRSPKLSRLVFRLCNAALDHTWLPHFPTSALTFSALRDLSLNSRCLAPVDTLFHQIYISRINKLSISLFVPPSTSDLVSFFTTLHEACSHDTLNSVVLRVPDSGCMSGFQNSPSNYITFDCLCPLTTFVNITSIFLDTTSGVDLNEHELLSLASAWPHLEKFEVGKDFDWTESSAITPGGFLQLLERCRSLRVLYFRFDTRGYTEIPQGHPWRGLTMPKDAFLHLLNSPIQKESMEALSIFFHVAPYPDFEMTTHWSNRFFKGSKRPQELCDLYYDRWVDVRTSAYNLWETRRDLRYSLETRFSQGHQ